MSIGKAGDCTELETQKSFWGGKGSFLKRSHLSAHVSLLLCFLSLSSTGPSTTHRAELGSLPIQHPKILFLY